MALGYREFTTKEFIYDDDSYVNAMWEVMNNKEEQAKFFGYIKDLFEDVPEEKKNFVEWFYSGNWIREEVEEC